MAFYHRTTATFNLFALLCSNMTCFDIGIRQHRPDGIALCFECVDFSHSRGNVIA
ncbi:Uncharacterised protein [Shigella sonnei]|nr:Uncharacterised protein [Shigella sonnei]CSR60597.1 Uncharacterised protein [Shigella sonnei]